MPNRQMIACASLFAMAASISQPAFAQDQSEVANSDIVVTAQRKTQTLLDVPVAVSVVSSETVANYGLDDLAEISQLVPTVKIAQTAVVDVINIRGFGSGINLGFEQAVPTFVGGSYRSRAISNRLSLFDIERVEVLKGPQTTYFGANATAGAFVITPRGPKMDGFHANAGAFYGLEYGEYSLEGGVDIPLGSKAAVRIAGKYNGSNGYVENRFTGGKLPKRNDYSLRGSLVVEPTATFTSRLRAEYGNTDSRGDNNSELTFCSTTDRPFGIAPQGQCAAYLAFAAANGITPDAKLDYRSDGPPTFFKAEYVEVEWNNRLDTGGGVLTGTSTFYTHDYDKLANPLPLPMLNNLGQPYLLPSRTNESFDQFTQEFRWESNVGERLDYTLGAYYLSNELGIENYTGLLFNRILPPGTGAYLRQQQKQEIASAFAVADYDLTERLKFSLGLRYVAITKRARRQQDVVTDSTLPPGEDPRPLPAATQATLARLLGYVLTDFPVPRRRDDGFMPSITLQYNFENDLMAYAKYVNGFKGGGYAFTNNINLFDREKVESYEVGFRGRPFSGIFFSLIAYQMNFDGLQESANRTNPVTGAIESFVDNVGSARARGAELSISWTPINGLSVNADAAYLDSKYKSYPGATCDQITTVMTGRRLCDLSGRTRPFSPKWSGSIRANYRTDVGFADAFIEPALEFSSSYYTTAVLEPVSVQGSYAKVNLRLGIEAPDDSWSLALVGRNITNRKTSDFRNILPASAGSGSALLNPPRQIALQASFRM